MRRVLFAVTALSFAAACTTASVQPGPALPAPDGPPQVSGDPLSVYDTAGLVVVGSPHSVGDTLDRLTTIIQARGAQVFARVDHAGGAANVGQDLGPMQLLIFGNPTLGTPLLQASPTAGIDLPLRVLAWEQDGATFVAYTDVSELARRHQIDRDLPALARIERALNGLVGQAVSQD